MLSYLSIIHIYYPNLIIPKAFTAKISPEVTVPNLGETIYQSLKDKEGTPVTLEIYDPQEIIRGVVEKIQYPIQSNPNFGSVTRYAIITIRGTRQEVYATLTSGNAPGINAYGIMRFG